MSNPHRTSSEPHGAELGTDLSETRGGNARVAALVIVGLVAVFAGVAIWRTGAGMLPFVLAAALCVAWLYGLWRSSLAPWRVVDIVLASVLGVLGGLMFWGWNLAWEPLSNALAFFPPLSAIAVGVWLLPGVLGGLVIRRVGAAVYVELVAALVSAMLGNAWGFATVWYGLLEGLGAEVVLALLLYRRFGVWAAVAAGAGAGIVVGLLDSFVYYPTYEAGFKAIYIAFAVLSGMVIAGVGAYALTRALLRTGALAPLASGRDAVRV